jgi:hypothetical protein
MRWPRDTSAARISQHEISRQLQISRHTVRQIIRQQGGGPQDGSHPAKGSIADGLAVS